MALFAGAGRTWVLKIVADIDEAKKGIADVEKSSKTFGDRAKGLGKVVGAALGTAAVVSFGKSVIQAASDTEQSLGGARSVFGEFSKDIEDLGKTAAKNLGVSNQEFLRMSTLMGALLKNTGLPMDEVAKSTENLTQRAADLAAMYGGTAAQAMEAMSSALKGEFNPLESFGVSLKASTIEAKALAMGLVDTEGKVTDVGKAMATQALIMEQSADAAGTYAKESGTLAGRTQTMQAQFKDLQATIGQALLPVVVKLVSVLTPFIEFIAANTDWLIPVVAGVLAFAAALKIYTIAQGIANAVMLGFPLVWVVLAIAAVVAAIVLLVKHWDTIVAAVKIAGEAIVDAMQWVWDSLQSLFATIVDIITYPFRKAWELIKGIASQIVDIWRGFLDGLRWLFGQVYDVITYPFRRAWDTIKYIGEQIKGIWTGFVGSLRYAFSQVYDIISYPFRRAMETIKWLWNSTIGGFGFSIPSWVPLVGGKEFRIPKMATGGIVTSPMIAMLGEAGREAVIPLDRFGELGTTNIYNITVQTLRADSETGRLIHESLTSYEKASGIRR